MNQEVIPVTIVPRLKKDLTTAFLLEEHFSWRGNSREDYRGLSFLDCILTFPQMYDLNSLAGHMDLVVVYSRRKVPLNGAFKSHYYEEAGVQLFSPTALPHPGKMTSADPNNPDYQRSHAEYCWLIKRQTQEDDPDNSQAGILIQYLMGRTSCHHHNETREVFMNLSGGCTLFSKEGDHPITERILSKRFFTTIQPGTIHQLDCSRPSVNMLCMYPLDLALKDHHYDPSLIDQVKMWQVKNPEYSAK